MNIVTYNDTNQKLKNELVRKGWSVSSNLHENTNILIYNSDKNKLAQIMNETRNQNKILIINSKDKNINKIVEDIERKTYESLF